MKQKKIPLSLQIFLALGLGIAVGMAFTGNPTFAVSYIKPFGTIFLNLLKFVVVPIVFFSILSGIISMSDISKVGSIGVKTLVYYTCTTAGAIVLAMFLCHWALIGLSKVYFFGIPEDYLLACSIVPALYIFFREYIRSNEGRPTKPSPRVLNALLVVLCIIIGASFAFTMLHQLNLFTDV